MSKKYNDHVEDCFVFWSHKGGVGKTFLATQVALELADENPKKNLLFIDMDNQGHGAGFFLNGVSEDFRYVAPVNTDGDKCRTSGAYFREILLARGGRVVDIDPAQVSALPRQGGAAKCEIPKNLWVLPPSHSLEEEIQNLVIRNAVRGKPAFAYFVELQKMIDRFTATKGGEWIVVIDCAPSWSTSTHMALVAGTKWIAPFLPDKFAEIQITTIMDLLLNPQNVGGDFSRVYFANALANGEITMAKLHRIIFNRMRARDGQYVEADEARKASALRKLFDIIKRYDEDVLSRVMELTDAKDVQTLERKLTATVSELPTVAQTALATMSPIKRVKAQARLFPDTPSMSEDVIRRGDEDVRGVTKSLGKIFLSM